MFFGVYDDSCRESSVRQLWSRRTRANGSTQRPTSTTTVPGLFLKWESRIEEVKLHPGDVLVICTDGVTEAPKPQGEEYGEIRLAKLVQTNRGLPVNELMAAIQAGVEAFSVATQADDITLIVARCR